jgi:hypothetical protein
MAKCRACGEDIDFTDIFFGEMCFNCWKEKLRKERKSQKDPSSSPNAPP